MFEPSSLQGHQLGDDLLKSGDGQWEHGEVGLKILLWIMILDQLGTQHKPQTYLGLVVRKLGWCYVMICPVTQQARPTLKSAQS